MKVGPDLIVECPNSRSLSRQQTLISVNTIGARWWTDGKMVAPMHPESPTITKCRNCNYFFWVKEAKVLGEVEFYSRVPRPDQDPLILHGLEKFKGEQNPETRKTIRTMLNHFYHHRLSEWLTEKAQLKDVPESWDNAPYVSELSEDEYHDALALGMAKTREQELFLRIKAWWAGNDALRDMSRDGAGCSALAAQRHDRATENLSKLWHLLDADNLDERLMKAEVARELGLFEDALTILKAGVRREQAVVADRIRSLAEAKDTNVREVSTEGAYLPHALG